MTTMSLLSFDEVLEKLLAAARPVTEIEEVDTVAAAGRTLARAQTSGIVVPPLDNSAMDGYAVRLADVPASGIRLPVSQRIPAGSVGTPLQPGTAARIFTGAPVPARADTILIQENARVVAEGVIEVVEPVASGRHIRAVGLDFRAGDVLIRAGTRLDWRAVSLAAAMNHPVLPVSRRPRVAVLATGDELVPPGTEPGPDQIVASNAFGVLAMVEAEGGFGIDLGIAADTEAAIAEKMSEITGGMNLPSGFKLPF